MKNLVALIWPNLKKQDTNLQKTIPVEKRVGVALWRLAIGNSFRSVAKMFAICKSTAVKITHDKTSPKSDRKNYSNGVI